jgi:GGDEF domain-containing protein
MADVASPIPAGLESIEDRLSEPEPMCLALLAIEPGPAPGGHTSVSGPALIETVGQGLRDTLRRYDELLVLPDGRFVVILPTLTEAEGLANRIERLFDTACAPRRLGGDELEVRCLFGAAVRRPAESPAVFLNRVVEAVEQARVAGGGSPVLV